MKASEARAIVDEKNGVSGESSLFKILTDIAAKAEKGETQLCMNKSITKEVKDKLLGLGYGIEESKINYNQTLTFITW